MSNVLIQDQADRSQIAAELNKNFLVEAGAGSGKTSSLVGRMIQIIRTGFTTVDKIAAITFTKKAANELKQRFQTGLETACHDAVDEDSRARLEEALMNLDCAFLGTIHAFCAQLLHERPVEAGIDPEFKDLDEEENQALLRAAWDAFLFDVKKNAPEQLEVLDALGVTPKDLQTIYMKLSTFPDVSFPPCHAARPDLTEALPPLTKAVNDAVRAIPDDEPEKGYDALQQKILQFRRLSGLLDLTTDKQIIRLLSIFESGVKVTQNRWDVKAEAIEWRDYFSELREQHVLPLLTAWREHCYGEMMDFIQPAIRRYEQAKNQKSGLNFQDLLMTTRRLLKDHPEVRQYFQQKYRCLLVDEFQDTDPLQAEILFYLTGDHHQERDWRKCVPLPGSLFVVGDPKQSIYRFRRADIDIYNTVKTLIANSGGDILDLTMNFRSVSSVTERLNVVFRQLLSGNDYQATFKPLQAARTSKDEAVQVLSIPSEYSKKDEIIAFEADAVAKTIAASLCGGIRLTSREAPHQASDFMILTRYKDGMTVYAQALEKWGIPVHIAGDTALNESVFVQEWLTLLRFLCDPSDRLQFVAVLRGLFFGISDDALYQYKTYGGQFELFQDVPEQMPDEIRSSLMSAFEYLHRYHQWSQQLPPAVAMEKIMKTSGLLSFAAAQDETEAAYLYQVLEYVRSGEVDGVTSFDQALAAVEEWVAARPEEALTLDAHGHSAVRIMNVHKAKGLEAPVVFLVNPMKLTTPPVDRHIRRTDNGANGFMLLQKSVGTWHKQTLAQPQGWQTYAQEEARYLTAEEDRLLYVAATRAEDALIISSSEKSNKRNPWYRLIEYHPDLSVLQVPEHVTESNQLGEKVQAAPRDPCVDNWVEPLSQPSLAHVAPTDEKKSSAYWKVERYEGGGTAWGSVIHRGLEALVKGEKTEWIVQQSLRDHELLGEDYDHVQAILELFQQSSVWDDLRAADECYAEMPFAVQLIKGDRLYHSVAQWMDLHHDVVHLSGVIDLVYQKGETWTIVDYKTDRMKHDEDMSILMEEYYQQLQVYKAVLATMVPSDENCRAYIYFTEKDELCEV
ncbi:UvrD-helicase domain-containing protein [Tuberibacillus sp. Marseille-P3662]|uniref:UvrD-helicase domain-containing protein n=1 Tax=Tuberibacillus sp. Marseille-P3662 TaxID=1965358 RepID=UPI000A1C82EF|nr:UvrD-helicase domain-containing protein [Tuberibacillus sp. Marseille-P3662]